MVKKDKMYDLMSEIRNDSRERVAKKYKEIFVKDKSDYYYNESQKLLADKANLNVDYLLNIIDKKVYIEKSKGMNLRKNKLTKEIIEFRDKQEK